MSDTIQLAIGLLIYAVLLVAPGFFMPFGPGYGLIASVVVVALVVRLGPFRGGGHAFVEGTLAVSAILGAIIVFIACLARLIFSF